uniref:Right handed beta helix domain-containing protein n=1 Tax=viral metagenome TaxID=1070528 RepID=A0A6M3XE48_9ZZZZ
MAYNLHKAIYDASSGSEILLPDVVNVDNPSPIVIEKPLSIKGRGAGTVINIMHLGDLFHINSWEWLTHESTVNLDNFVIRRNCQIPYSTDPEAYPHAIKVLRTACCNIDRLWIGGDGIGVRFCSDAHNVNMNRCRLARNRIGIYNEKSGAANVTDVWMSNNFIIGEFGSYASLPNHGEPVSEDRRLYNYGYYQKADTVGDCYLDNNVFLRFNAGIYIERVKSSVPKYAFNYRLHGNVVDQMIFNGLIVIGVENSIFTSNQIMNGEAVKNAEFIRCNNNTVTGNQFRGKKPPMKFIDSKGNVFEGNFKQQR